MAIEYELSRDSIRELRRFIGGSQMRVMLDAMKGEEGEWFYNKFNELLVTLKEMPKTYQNRERDAVVYLHYFVGGCDWWISERDMGDPKDPGDDGQHQAFGYACLGDPSNAESGYISIVELLENHAELDLHWKPKLLHEVIQELQGRGEAEPPKCVLCNERTPATESDVCLDCQKLLRWIE